MNWKLICAVRALSTFMPFSRQLRMLKRRIAPFSLGNASLTLDSGLDMIDMLHSAGFNPSGKTIVEIGTGWVPVIPLLLFLLDAEDIILIDKHVLLDTRSIMRVSLFLKKIPPENRRAFAHF